MDGWKTPLSLHAISEPLSMNSSKLYTYFAKTEKWFYNHHWSEFQLLNCLVNVIFIEVE